MEEGLLWFDRTLKRNIEDNVRDAAERYRAKFGVEPDTCYIHAGQMNGVEEVNGVRLVGAGNILKHHFWIGVEDAAALKEAA